MNLNDFRSNHQFRPFVFFIAMAFAVSCSGNAKKQATQGTSPRTDDDKVLLMLEDAKPGLTIRLSEGADQGPKVVRQKLAATSEMAASQATQLLTRMPDLKASDDDKKNFAIRPGSKPAPRTGKTVEHSFPPKQNKKAPGTSGSAATPLEVRRVSPEGSVPMAPHLSVSFSDAMVAVTSQDQAAKTQPVKLSPQPEGRWRWIGTKTVLFDPLVRFPMSTRYEVVIPQGTKSANGASLAKEKRFDFTTATVTLKNSYPQHGPQSLRPIIYMGFDQAINQSELLGHVVVRSKGTDFPVRAATAEEIKKDEKLSALIEAQKKKDDGKETRWIAALVDTDLPEAASVSVTLKKGAPSAEGPLSTASDQSFSFSTRGPLKVEKYRCSWGNKCPPGSGFWVKFSNPLDEKDFDFDTLKIEPPLAGARGSVRNNQLTIDGATESRTTYAVTIPATLKDKFGQELGEEKTLTFKVGDAQPRVFAHSGLSVADPAAKFPSYAVHSVNVNALDVQVYKVSIDDWSTYRAFMQGNPRRPKPAPGKKVFDKTIQVKGETGRMSDTLVDLRAALNSEELGHAVVVVKPVDWPSKYKPEYKSWVQVTKLGVDAFMDASELLVWTTDLASGKPLLGVDTKLSLGGTSGKSDKRGLTTLAIKPHVSWEKGHQLLIASRGSDSAIVASDNHYYGDSTGFFGRAQPDRKQWFIFNDRGMYKPGEKVRVKGWIRTFEGREGGDIRAINGVSKVAYTVFGTRNNKISEGTAEVSKAGGFDLEVLLPKEANLGNARIQFDAGAERAYHSFQIQEFRRPEFEVSAKSSPGPHIVGKGADVSVSAKYYAGGPLPGAEVSWNVHSNATSFTPPNQDEYTFGSWTPWWGWSRGGPTSTPNQHQNFSGKTDASGKHVLHMDFLSVKPPRPMSVVAQASVVDVNRQSWASTSTVLVHPSDLYVGLKRDRYFVNKGEPIKVQGVVANQDGELVSGRKATIRAVLMDWEYKGGKYVDVERNPQTCEVVSGDKEFECEFATKEGGRYKITATVTDDESRPNQSEITTWVSGGKQPPKRNVEQELVTMIPDKKEYAAGDTATILIEAPFAGAEGVMTLRRSGVTHSESFSIKGTSHTLKVPIQEGYVPNISVQVDLVGSAVRVSDKGEEMPGVPKRPAYAKGSLNLAVPPTQRTLAVRVVPAAKKVTPGAKTSIAVEVKDAQGAPAANTEVVAIVVDESVLALSNYTTPDPIAAFYGQRGTDVRDFHQRQWLKLADPEAGLGTIGHGGGTGAGYGGGPEGASLARGRALGGVADMDMDGAPMPAPMAVAEENAPGEAKLEKRSRKDKSKRDNRQQPGTGPIAVRKNFDALAVFAPQVITDAAGRATLSFEVPDNLTRYRVMVVASASENNFGKGESNITARMPLMVRPSPPRFLNFGDKFELPVVVQNQTDSPMSVGVAVRATNATLGKTGLRVEVPANDRVEVRFPASAEMAGTARFQVVASESSASDANEFSLPVWTPATTEAFATYGVVDKGAISQPVEVPPNVVKTFGNLNIGMSSTQMQALTDAFVYLVQYPYECAEQTASRVMGVAALRDVLSAFKAKGLPGADELQKVMQRDLKRLSSLQNYNGGFAFWQRDHEAWPYISIHVAHALTRAKDKGYKIPDGMLDKSKEYLRNIRRHIPAIYGEHWRRMLESYAVYVRKRMGDVDVDKAKKLLAEVALSKHSFQGLGWLLSVLHEDPKTASLRSKIHRHLDNNVSETAGAANWNEGYSDNGYLVLHSNRRTDGVLLEALIEDKPKSDLIPKVVRGLLAHRKRGRWGNTQDNVFVLQAMDTYFRTYEKITPNFVARAWLGDDFAGEQAFRGRSTERHEISIPMQYLAKKSGSQSLTIAKEGKGRLYYRVGMTYAPSSLKLEAADYGFAVERQYEAVDDPADVVRLKDGTWKVKAGAKVRVRLRMVAENRRYHVALVDPLPAGLEAMNPALAVTGAIPQDPKAAQSTGGRYWWWFRTWYEHQNMRDERIEAFTSLLWAGVHEYTYVTRATTPGRFIVPPSKAEEMYSPETFGRSASDVVIVE